MVNTMKHREELDNIRKNIWADKTMDKELKKLTILEFDKLMKEFEEDLNNP